MSWYDVFSYFYDAALERMYRPYRIQAVEALELSGGHTVMDLACGTGQNFRHLMEHLGPEGILLGADYSEGMLKKAQKKVDRGGWENVFLVQKDARELGLEDLAQAVEHPVELDRILVVLGLSVIPDWKKVFAQTFSLLAPGGRYVIFDVHASHWVPQTSMVQLMAQAELSRKVWEPLEEASDNFELSFLDGSPHIHGGKLLLASGSRP